MSRPTSAPGRASRSTAARRTRWAPRSTPGGGFARIYGPDGAQLGGTLDETAEGLVIADIDLGLISLSKAAADPAGHHARPDVTRLRLNKPPGEPVVSCVPAGAFVELGAPATEAAAPA